MAALTASQAPAAMPARAAAAEQVRQASAEQGPSVSGDSPYRTELPPLGLEGTAPVARGALPETVFAAYRRAEEELARTAPGCGLRWQLLAAIGQVESGQARGGRVTADGTAVPSILGPRLTGGPYAVIRDTDGGAYDGDTEYDRAVGPMQFIPSTWARWGTDGNGDGRTDPDNIFDAALAAGRYLCAGGRNLADPADLDRAILGYNQSSAYLRTVRAWYTYFLEGHLVVPDRGAGSDLPAERPSPSRPESPKPSPKPTGPRPGASSSPTPSATSSPTTAPAPEENDEPPLPFPSPPVELPLPSAGQLTGNGANTIGAAPSTTAATGR
ncbi:lytic transglycosylase domain-containing protein [Streptomyces sp. NPDC018693]|uniref:lytic transglycosylase domain-containing protein n=1 Tax=unclassified Streptomyces TaxID=2593676 RepID=UPI00378FA508